MKLSKYVTLREATISQTAIRNGIDNTPPPDIIENMRYVAENLFDVVREHFGQPIQVNSFYRCEELNTAIGGSKTSDHMRGYSVDVDGLNGVTNSDIFFFVKDHCNFDQVIAEFKDGDHPAWVHMSLRRDGNRKQALIAHKKDGKTVYSLYSDELFESLYRKT